MRFRLKPSECSDRAGVWTASTTDLSGKDVSYENRLAHDQFEQRPAPSLHWRAWREDTQPGSGAVLPRRPLAASLRLHLDRTAGGHCDYRDSGRPAPARVVCREREIQADVLLEQSPSNGPRDLHICG